MQFFVGPKAPMALLILLLVFFVLFTNAKHGKAVHSSGTCKRGNIRCNGGCHKKCTRNSQCIHRKMRCKSCQGSKRRFACQY